jgi:hypothetical protein
MYAKLNTDTTRNFLTDITYTFNEVCEHIGIKKAFCEDILIDFRIAYKYKSKWYPWKGKEHLFFPQQFENIYTNKLYTIWFFTKDTIREIETYI